MTCLVQKHEDLRLISRIDIKKGVNGGGGDGGGGGGGGMSIILALGGRDKRRLTRHPA